jgi:hypothetical protein
VEQQRREIQRIVHVMRAFEVVWAAIAQSV